jgi:1-acyl-sn-glycerol-3-phosphate acyltransferase
MRATRTSKGAAVTRSYRALKGVAWIVISVFYRRIDVTGEAQWRGPGRPTIVAANHTNALADPVVILAKLPGHPRFLAAGSWLKFAPARWLFRLASVVPIYRRRDGGGSDANSATFSACHEALAEGATLAVFPEGELHYEPSIAPLKTGAARIALGAAAEAGVRDLALLPVGIVYEDRGRFRSQVAVQVGAPVPVDPWVERYHSDPRGTVRALTLELADGLRAVTVNHESWDDLRLVDRAATITLADDRSLERRYARRNELRRGLGAALTRTGGRDDPAWAGLAVRVADHQRELDALGLDLGRTLPTSDGLARERGRLRVVLAAVAPAAAVGAVSNAPVAVVLKGVAIAVKDPAWQATTKGVAGLLFCPIVWGCEAYLVRRHGRRAVLGVLVAAPLGGLAWIGWRELRARWRQVRSEAALLGTRAEEVRAAAATRADVRARVDALIAATATPPNGSDAAVEVGASPADQSASASTT